MVAYVARATPCTSTPLFTRERKRYALPGAGAVKVAVFASASIVSDAVTVSALLVSSVEMHAMLHALTSAVDARRMMTVAPGVTSTPFAVAT